MRVRTNQSKEAVVAQSEKKFLVEALEARDKMIIDMSVKSHNPELSLSELTRALETKKEASESSSGNRFWGHCE